MCGCPVSGGWRLGKYGGPVARAAVATSPPMWPPRHRTTTDTAGRPPTTSRHYQHTALSCGTAHTPCPLLVHRGKDHRRLTSPTGVSTHRLFSSYFLFFLSFFGGGGDLAKGPKSGYPKTKNSTELGHYFWRGDHIHFRKKNPTCHRPGGPPKSSKI